MALRFVVTVDDVGGLVQDLGLLDQALTFFDSEGVPVSFFAVPRGQGDWEMHRRPEWLSVMRAAEERGHDIQLHGLDHGPCEFGPYPEIVLAMGGDPQERLESDTAEYGHLWRTDLFVEKLQAATGIFRQAFGREPQVFRGGALTHSPELYQALAQVGIRYVSNNVTDPRGWRYIIGEYDTSWDWDPKVPPRPYPLAPGVTDLPIISEYAWYLAPEKIAPHLALAVEDLGRVHQADGVFLLVCHVQCVGAEDGLSRQLLRRLFAAARDQHAAQFMTVRELIAQLEAAPLPSPLS